MLDVSSKTLNQKQKEAVMNHNGPMLVIAGAGTGKTRTITYRIASLIDSGISPEKILAITFTNKAANEMKERVYNLLKENRVTENNTGSVKNPFISTFHALGSYILRSNAEEIGLKKTFMIANRDRSKQIIKEALKRHNLDTKVVEPAKLLSFISRQKNSLMSIEEFSKNAKGEESSLKAVLWEEYEKILGEESSVDFDDLLVKPLKLIKRNKKTQNYYQDLWSHIHIDEYQDTNEVQYELAKILSKKNKNICVTGDLDQCIYSWRGAKVEAILNFEKEYPGTKTVVLEKNYRSTKTILSAANNIISLNQNRKEKKLYTSNKEGDKIVYTEASSESEEAYSLIEEIKELFEKGALPSDMAVLYRTNFQSRILEESFLHSGIPYMIIGTKFLERQEIRDVLAYIESALNDKNKSSIKRIINTPSRGIGEVTMSKYFQDREEELSDRAQKNINNFKFLLEKIRKKSEKVKVSELVKYVIVESGLNEWYKKKKEEERIENIKELVTLATQYDNKDHSQGLESFLEHVTLLNDQDTLPTEERECIKLMTVHSAKGLEFKYVFITGLEEGLFPHRSTGDEPRDEEEERRLFYVALTRAQKKAFLFSSTKRTIFGSSLIQKPSRFIFDLGDELIEFKNNYSESGGLGLLSEEPLPPIY